jgi:hypothetical protein
VHLGLAEADAGVGDPQRRAGRLDPHRSGRVRVDGAPRGDGVDGVLQQLAHVHPRAGVQVLGQQVDQPTEVYLKSVR